MSFRIVPALAFIIALTSLPAAAVAPENDFIGRFGGTWSGSGTVIKGEIPLQVSCRVTGDPGQNQIAIEGSCSLAIASMRIAADIAYDPASGRYSGTYIGAKVGPARVSGKRSGDVVNLTVSWPQPVNGQMKAHLVIENAGSGRLRIVLNEYVAQGGAEKVTHDLVLSQG
jgi:hypothetical protein